MTSWSTEVGLIVRGSPRAGGARAVPQLQPIMAGRAKSTVEMDYTNRARAPMVAVVR